MNIEEDRVVEGQVQHSTSSDKASQGGAAQTVVIDARLHSTLCLVLAIF